MIKKMPVVLLLLIVGGLSVFAQSEFEPRNREIVEKKFSYSTVIQCYQSSDTLDSFTFCLENSNKIHDWDDKFPRDPREPDFDEVASDKEGIFLTEQRLPINSVENFGIPD